MLDKIKWDEFSLEAFDIYQGLIKNQEELINRGILEAPKFNIEQDYIVDLTRMLKVVYNKNLKNFIMNSSGVMLSDALSNITDKLFLTKKLSEKGDKRRTYELPDYSLFIIKNDVKIYLDKELNNKYLDSVSDLALENLEHKDYKYSYTSADLDSTYEDLEIQIEKTRLTKPQLIIMGFKKDLDKISELKDSRLKSKTNLKKISEIKLYNLKALDLHRRAIYNYLAMILQNGMIDFIKDTYSEMSQELSGVVSNSQDDDDLRDYDRYFMVDDDSQDLLKEIELIEDVKKLAQKAFEIQEDDSYKVEAIEVILQLSMYSFNPKEISKILDTPFTVVNNIRELLKEALFNSAMDSKLEAITDLDSIDKYLENMGDNLSEYKESNQNKDLSIVSIQKQLKETMGSSYYKVQEIREYLDSRI